MDSSSLILRLFRLLSLFVFFFFSHRSIVSAKLISKPNDTESLVGGMTFLNCSTDNVLDEIFWFHYDVGSEDRKLVYGFKKFYTEYEGRFQLERTEGAGSVAAFNLVIPLVMDRDAGRYECQDGAGQGERSNPVQMIVLVSAPVCETDIRRPEGVIGPNSCGLTPEDVHLTCRVSFVGNEAPMVAWFRGRSSIQQITEGVSRSQSTESVVFCNATMAADPSIDGLSFECRTTRSATDQHQCTTEAVTVTGNNSLARTLIVVVICLAVVLVAFMIGFFVYRLAVYRAKRRKRKRFQDAKEKETHPMVDLSSPETPTSNNAKCIEENKRLMEELNRCENIIYRKVDEVKNKNKPIFAHNIKTKRSDSLISGITLLGDHLYVAHEKCSSIEVYDSKTFTFQGSLPVKNLENPSDIASSESSGCLYIADKYTGIQLETKKPNAVEEIDQMPFVQSKVNEKDVGEIKSREESLESHDKKKDKEKKNVQKNNKEKVNGEEENLIFLEKDPTQNSSNQSPGQRRPDGAQSEATDKLSEEHQTGDHLTGSNKDCEAPDDHQQEQSTDDEKIKLLSETTQSKDDRNESALKEGDKKKSDEKDSSSVEDENVQRKHQVSVAEAQKDETTDDRKDDLQKDPKINQFKACSETSEAECRILALKYNADLADLELRHSWTVDDTDCRLSSVYSSNVIVCLPNKRLILEYSFSGEMLRSIGLSPGDGFHQLFHAIQVSQSHFAVSHSSAQSSNDRRLSITDEKGKVKFISKNEQMASYLVVDCNKSILVSDESNCRILLFEATLNEYRELIPKGGILSKIGKSSNVLKNQPTRITLDEENGRLFVALSQKDEKTSESKGVSVFKVA